MAVYHITRDLPNWLMSLANTLKKAESGDIITVYNENVLELAISAAKRMNKWPDVRLMTEATYAEQTQSEEERS